MWILASASPRRRRLARLFCVPFRAISPKTREARGPQPGAALLSAGRKARWVSRRFPGVPVVACDTVVRLGGRTLGKPRSWKEARRMLRLLSGRSHEVLTGLCVIDGEGRERARVVKSRVLFRRIPEQEVPALVRRMGSLDKAGGYTAEGRHSPVLSVRGSRSNVLGFPLAEVGRFLPRSRPAVAPTLSPRSALIAPGAALHCRARGRASQ